MVDPKNNIHAKLPCHIRVQATKFDRNERIRTTMEAAKRKRDALEDLHEKISPVILDSSSNTAQEDSSPAANIAAPTQTRASSRKRKSAALGLSIALKQPALPRPFHIPPPQALHAAPYVLHGGMIIGHKPITERPTRNSICTLCQRNNGIHAITCPGRGSHKRCKYFNTDGTRKPPIIPTKTRFCRKCGIIGCKGVGGHKYCTNS